MCRDSARGMECEILGNHRVPQEGDAVLQQKVFLTRVGRR